MAGSIIRRPYKAGSIIYFERDRGDNVYVLQQGMIRLISSALDSKEEIHENVKQGEFFGVKSSLGRYPREETAQVLADSVVLVFDMRAFEELCLKNVRLVLQLLKSFSSQLRRIHRQVREQLGEYSNLEVSAELLRVGEYYYKHDKNDKAKYIFEKFMSDHQSSPSYQRAVTLKQSLDAGQPYPDIVPLEESSDMEDGIRANANQNAISSGEASSERSQASEVYYEGLNLISQENIDEAIKKFQEVMAMKSFSNSEEAALLEQSHFELNKCYVKKGNFDTAITSTTDFIKKYPQSQQIKKSLLVLAESFEGQNNMSKAMAFYGKVANLSPRDKDSSLAAKKLEKLQS